MALDNSIAALIHFERKWHRIPPFHDTPEVRFQIFSTQLARNLKIPSAQIVSVQKTNMLSKPRDRTLRITVCQSKNILSTYLREQQWSSPGGSLTSNLVIHSYSNCAASANYTFTSVSFLTQQSVSIPTGFGSRTLVALSLRLNVAVLLAQQWLSIPSWADLLGECIFRQLFGSSPL